MRDEMICLLIRYYRLSPEGAAEVLSELRDTRALASLTRPYGDRAMLKNDLHG